MNLAENLERILAGFPAVRLAVLFGSAARGTDNARSDVDLGVFLEEDDPSQLWPIDVAAAGAVRRTIDLVDLRRAPPLLRFAVARDGRPLIEREEGEWPRFKARAMLDWWEWAPYARRFNALAAQRLREEVRRGQG
jgi:predicted nucleotidyltransferase